MVEGRPNRGAEIVFCGRSNVGKSTLLRELTGHDFETGKKPGVTRSPGFFPVRKSWPVSSRSSVDLPTFERPQKTTSAPRSGRPSNMGAIPILPG